MVVESGTLPTIESKVFAMNMSSLLDLVLLSDGVAAPRTQESKSKAVAF